MTFINHTLSEVSIELKDIFFFLSILFNLYFIKYSYYIFETEITINYIYFLYIINAFNICLYLGQIIASIQ